MRKEYIGAICTRSMKALYNEYRSKELRREIVTLVPARPELEFPKAQSMKRRFILHIGPTNSGKTYQALESLSWHKTEFIWGRFAFWHLRYMRR